jgi:hypothetical protein
LWQLQHLIVNLTEFVVFCEQSFRGLFPVYDKNQARDFKKRVLDKLTVIEQGGYFPRGTVKASYLQSPGGERYAAPFGRGKYLDFRADRSDRFVIMAHKFAMHVVHSVFKRDYAAEYQSVPVFPALEPKHPAYPNLVHAIKVSDRSLNSVVR